MTGSHLDRRIVRTVSHYGPLRAAVRSANRSLTEHTPVANYAHQDEQAEQDGEEERVEQPAGGYWKW
uniref:Uncharacterized protein n=1 Tax=Caenorhabditis japonica TaxID=281687 RepID=A0A8R1IIT8_CAEJA